MFKLLRSWFHKERKIAFIDGDQDIPKALAAYTKYVANTGTETHLVRMRPANHAEPRILRRHDDINKVYLTGFTAKKEVTDKYIAGMIQQAVADGYTHITVISSDYDFIDIFKMAVMINPAATEVTFRMIAPQAQGRVADLPHQVANIEVVKA